jgi:hypothetical protein
MCFYNKLNHGLVSQCKALMRERYVFFLLFFSFFFYFGFLSETKQETFGKRKGDGREEGTHKVQFQRETFCVES